jgi:RNA polymerase sigma factor (sigma-70 family)
MPGLSRLKPVATLDLEHVMATEFNDSSSTDIPSGDPFQEALTANLQPLYRYIVTRARFFDAGQGVWSDDNRPAEMLDIVVAEALSRRDEWTDNTPTYRWLRAITDEVMARDAGRTDGEDLDGGVERFEEVSLDQLSDDTLGRPSSNDPLRLTMTEDTAQEQPMMSDASDTDALSPEERVVRDEFQNAFVAALRDLPDDLREVFLLHARDGFDSERIARMEGISVEDARQRFNDASEQLRSRMASEYDGLDEADDLPAIDTMYEAIEDLPLDSEYITRIAAALEQRNA